jgi:hypothetical protein
MAINSQGSGITVVTNVGGELVDNDEFVAYKAHVEHSRDSLPQSERPWASNYVPPKPFEPIDDDVPAIPEDATISKVNQKDLKTRNIK